MKKASKITLEHEAGELIYTADSEFKFQKERKTKNKNTSFQKDNLQPKNHNRPIRGMCQRLFKEWTLSGSWGPILEEGPAPCMASLPGTAAKDLSPIPSHSSHSPIPSAALQAESAPALVLQEKDANSVIEGIELASTSDCTGQEKGTMTRGFSSKVSHGSATQPHSQEWIEGRNMQPVATVSNLKTLTKEKCDHFDEMSIMVAGRNITVSIPFRKIWTRVSIPSLRFQLWCQKNEKPYSPHPCISLNSHFGFVCEKNMNSWLSLTTLDNKQDKGLNYFKMKKQIFFEKHLKS